MNINWLFLIIGGLFESVFAISLGKAQKATGTEKILWLISFAVSVGLSMYLLYLSMGGKKPIPTGTAYAVWAGIGAVFTVLLGIVYLSEPANVWRLTFLTILILSIVGLQIVTPT